MTQGLLGGIESGGTKIVCAVGQRPDVIMARCEFPTTEAPEDTYRQAADFFAAQTEEYGQDLLAVGVGSFGPCDPNPESPTYGYVTSTPKPGWADADVVGGLRRAISATGGSSNVPISFDTDVNAAALAESMYGAGADVSSLVYVTVGTGIGGGGIADGRLIHGLVHPEMGHILIPRPQREVDVFGGVCPYHGDCWEGVASGPAIEARWGTASRDLPIDHEAWDLEARYLAGGLHALVCVLSPQRVIVGGGVGSAPHVLPLVRPMLQESLAGYIDDPAIEQHLESYVVTPDLGGDAGVIGALILADRARAANTPGNP